MLWYRRHPTKLCFINLKEEDRMMSSWKLFLELSYTADSKPNATLYVFYFVDRISYYLDTYIFFAQDNLTFMTCCGGTHKNKSIVCIMNLFLFCSMSLKNQPKLK